MYCCKKHTNDKSSEQPVYNGPPVRHNINRVEGDEKPRREAVIDFPE